MGLNLDLDILRSDDQAGKSSLRYGAMYYHACDRFMLDLMRKTRFQVTESLFDVYRSTYMPAASMPNAKSLLSTYEDRLKKFFFSCVKTRLADIGSRWAKSVGKKGHTCQVPLPEGLAEAYESLVLPATKGFLPNSSDHLEYYSGDKIRHMLTFLEMSWLPQGENWKKEQSQDSYTYVDPYEDERLRSDRMVWWNTEDVEKVHNKIVNYLNTIDRSSSDNIYTVIRNACDLFAGFVSVCARCFDRDCDGCSLKYDLDVQEALSRDRADKAKSLARKYSHLDPVSAICIFPGREYKLLPGKFSRYTDVYTAMILQNACYLREQREIGDCSEVEEVPIHA